MRRLRTTLPAVAAALLGVAASAARADSVDATPAPAPAGLDVLFVVDDSSGMVEQQDKLVASFPGFVARLTERLGALPDLHVGVISTDVGAGGFQITNCVGEGDDGALQSAPRGSCVAPTGAFIEDVAGAGGTRTRNYEGTLEASFACIARLGVAGCGFEQPLESLRRSLDGSNPGNAGFLRPDATLLVVLVGDEDDCSAANPAIFDPDDDAPDGTLGRLSSFRCTEFGVTCAEGPVTRSAASYTGCRPRSDSPYLRDPAEYATFLKGLKADPRQVIVVAISGPPTPFAVELPRPGEPWLVPTCWGNPAPPADPGVRLASFAGAFGNLGRFSPICGEDDALTGAADLVVDVLTGVVVPEPPVDADAGPPGDAGTTPREPEDGCGCRVGAASTGPPRGVLLLLGLAALAWLYRRRAPSPRATR